MRLFSKLFVIGSFFFMVGCGNHVPTLPLSVAENPIAHGFQRVKGYDDLFVVQMKQQESPTSQDPTLQSCKENIARIICLLPSMPAERAFTPSDCWAGGEQYVAFFENIYDRYPASFQKLFCSLKQIFVLDQFFGSAFASIVTDPATKKVTGAQIGIRRSLLDQPISLERWASWKEELSFGGDPSDSYKTTSFLPYITTSQDAKNYDLIYYILSHEFGHVFDMLNNLNKATGADGKQSPEPASWGAISWATPELPKLEERFPYRRGLCFYQCDGEAMTRSAVTELYQGLSRSSFISTYAATSPMEEFAETLAYFMLDTQNFSYTLHTGQGEAYDVMMKFRSAKLAAKRQFIVDLLARSDLIYP